MTKITLFFISLIVTVIGVIVFIVSLINLNGSGMAIGAIMGFGGMICTIVFKTLLNSSKTQSNPTSTNLSYNTEPETATNNTQIHNEPTTIEYLPIKWNDLSYDQVINRYLTTDHEKCPANYKYKDYHCAEFDCILNNLTKAEINLSDEKVLRNQVILTPYEKSKNITASSKISKLKDFISIDVETTGLKTGYNDIIEISAIRFIDFEPKEIFSTLLKPRKPIPKEATEINGITDEMVANAPTFSQIHNSLKEFLGTSNLVMHNAAFDTKFLFVSGLEFPEKQNIFCTLELSKRFLKDWDGKPYDSYKLSEICSEVNIYFEGAHRSSADALATGLLFNEIVKQKMDITNLIEAATFKA